VNTSPGARAFCAALRACGIEHHDLLRRLANILPGWPKTLTVEDEAPTWSHRESSLAA
jgi:hypothetical protein